MGLKDTTTGDTLCDPSEPGRPGVDDVPRAGHLRGDRAEDQERPGEAGHRDPAAGRGGPDLPGPHRRGDRPDDHLGHGRAAPGGPGRPHAPRVQGRGQRRQAPGGLPRDDHQARREGRVHPQEADRWLRAVRAGHHRHRAHGRAATAATSSSTPSPVGASPRSTSPRWTPASRRPWSTASWPATRWSMSRSRCSTVRTTTSTPRSWPSRSPVRWPSRRPPAGPTPVLLEPMMAVEVTTPEDFMGEVIGDLNSRRGHIQAMDERAGARVVTRSGPAVGDVRLRRGPAEQDPGPGELLHAVRLLRRGSEQRGRRRSSRRRRASSMRTSPELSQPTAKAKGE